MKLAMSEIADIQGDPGFSELRISPSIYYPTLQSTARRIIHQGGQSSGKTVNILCVLATIAAQKKRQRITVTSESLPHLKRGALRDFEDYVYPYFRPYITNYNKTDHIFYFSTGSKIEFVAFDGEQKARGAKRQYLFVNEANSFDYLTFRQLDSRTDFQTIIDYNPSAPFWAHDKLIGQAGNQLFISDHRDNPFLSHAKHVEIESEIDPELFRVYARGKTGNITGLIYPNWQIIPDEQFPWGEDFFGGVDYGYTNDPTAGVKIVRLGDSLYVHELFYECGIPAKRLIQHWQDNKFTSRSVVYSEHDDEMITQQRRLSKGNLLILPAKKGTGSINAGIEKLKEFKVFYTASSKNIHEERKRYMWVIDPVTGKPTNAPIDQWNHALDAIRYGVYTHYFRK
jgi:phage terminase large subunit